MSQDRRQPGQPGTHRERADSPRTSSPWVSQPVPPGEPSDDSPTLSRPVRDSVITESRRTSPWRPSPSLSDGHPARPSAAFRLSLVREPWKGLSVFTSPRPSSCRCRCRAAVGGSSQRARLKCKNQSAAYKCGKQERCAISSGEFWGQAAHWTTKCRKEKYSRKPKNSVVKRVCALTARGSTSKTVNGLVGGSPCQAHLNNRKTVDYSSDSLELR